MSLVAPLINGVNMTLFASGVCTVDSYGFVTTHLKKEFDHRSRFDTSTSGGIKYVNLPVGTKVRVTIEVIEDGDGSQQIQK